MASLHDHSLCRTQGQHELNEYADKRGLSQAALGELIGVSQQTASKYLAGLAAPSRYEVVTACEEKCGVSKGAFRIPLSRPSRKASRRSSLPATGT